MIDRSLRPQKPPNVQVVNPPVQFVRFDRHPWYPTWPRIQNANTNGSDTVCLLRCVPPVVRNTFIPTALTPCKDVNDQPSKVEHFLWEEIINFHVPVLLRDNDDRFVSKTMLELILAHNLITIFHLDKPIPAVKPTNAEICLLRKINEFHMAGQLLRVLPFDRWNDQLIHFESLLDRLTNNPLAGPSSSAESSLTIASAAYKTGWIQINNVFLPFIRNVSHSLGEQIKSDIPFSTITKGIFVPLDILLDCPVLSDRAVEQIIRSVSIQANGQDLIQINQLISDARLSSELLKAGSRLVQVCHLMACIPKLFVRFLPRQNPKQFVSRRFGEASAFHGGILRNGRLISPFIYNLPSVKSSISDWMDISQLILDHVWLPASIWNCSISSRSIKSTEVEYLELLSTYFSGTIKPVQTSERLVCASSIATVDPRLNGSSIMFLEVFQMRQRESLLNQLCKLPTLTKKGNSSSIPSNQYTNNMFLHNQSKLQSKHTNREDNVIRHPHQQHSQQTDKHVNDTVLLKNPTVRLCRDTIASFSTSTDSVQLLPVNVQGKKLLSIQSSDHQKIPLAELKDMFFPELESEVVHLLCSQYMNRCTSEEMDILQRFKIDKHNDFCVHIENVEQFLRTIFCQQKTQNAICPSSVNERLQLISENSKKNDRRRIAHKHCRNTKQRRHAADDAERKIRISLMCDQSSDSHASNDSDDQPKRGPASMTCRRRYGTDLTSSSEDDQEGVNSLQNKKKNKRRIR